MNLPKTMARQTSRLCAFLVIATAAGLLLTSLVPAGLSPVDLLSESGEETTGEETDGDGFELEALDLLATPARAESLVQADYGDRVADDFVDTESALGATHPQRGPPPA